MANDKAGSWLLEAQKLLTQVNVNQCVLQAASNVEEKRWMVLYACYLVRACTLISGARSLVSNIEIPTIKPKIHLEDLEDITCTWFLDLATKRKTADLFLSLLSITLICLPLCQLLRRRTAEVLSSASETNGTRRSIMGELEELESRLMSWKTEHQNLLTSQSPWPAAPRSGDFCVLAMQSSARLSYE
jgi:hypothetical protein